MKKLKNNKGFTLVELIVSLALTALIVAAVTMMVGPMSTVIASLKSNTNYDTACDAANTYFRYGLQNAKNAKIVEFTNGNETAITDYISNLDPSATVKAIAVYNGKLYDLGYIYIADHDITGKLISSNRVFNDDFYNGYRYSVAFQSQTEVGGTNCKWIKIVSQFVDSSGNIANQSREMTFKILGGSMTISGSDVTAGNNFVVFYTVPILPA